MRRFPLLLIICNVLVTLLFTELGMRAWAYHRSVQADDFDRVSAAASATKRGTIPGEATLGQLIEKSESSGRVYEFIPNLTASFQHHAFSTNAYGFRDDEYTLEKPPGVKRIIGIGDSVMFGWGVNPEESYLSILEKELNTTGQKVEVLNFAVPGYNTAMEVATYEALARKFHPDVVLIHFVSNDLDVPLWMQRPEDFLTFKKSYLWDAVRKVFRGTRSKSDKLVGIELSGIERHERQSILRQYQYMVGEGGYRLAMKKLADLTAQDNAKVIVLAGKFHGHTGKMIRKKVAQKYGFTTVEVAPVVEAYCAAHGIADDPQARQRALTLSRADRHPSPLGHQLYAEALLPVLQNALQ